MKTREPSVDACRGTDADGQIFGIFRAALDVLHRADIKVCLMRDDPQSIDHITELDLLISDAALGLATRVLCENGWTLFDRGLFIPHKRALLKFHDGVVYKIDAHKSFIDGPYVYMDAAAVIERAELVENNIHVLTSADWLCHVTLHTILGKSVLGQKYLARFSGLAEDRTLMARGLEEARKFGLERIYSDVAEGPASVLCDEDRVAQLKKIARRALRWQPGNIGRLVRWYIAWSLGQILGLRKGFSIAILGPDGAGKTSFIEALRGALREMEVPVRVAYMGPWEYPLLPTTKFLRWLGASPQDKITGTGMDQRPARRWSKLAKGLIKRYLYYGNILLEVWARYFALVFCQMRLRRVVLCDRYVYDLLIGNSNTPVKNSEWIRRAICFLTPRPHIVVFLDGDEQVIWSRKKEYDLDVIASALMRYRNVAQRYGFESIVSDRPTADMVADFIEKHGDGFLRWRREGWHSK